MTCRQTVIHPSSNRARYRATALIETNVLTTTPSRCTPDTETCPRHAFVQCSVFLENILTPATAKSRRSIKVTGPGGQHYEAHEVAYDDLKDSTKTFTVFRTGIQYLFKNATNAHTIQGQTESAIGLYPSAKHSKQ